MATRRQRIDASVGEAMGVTLAMLLLMAVAAFSGPLAWWCFPLLALGWWLGLAIKALVGGYRDDPR